MDGGVKRKKINRRNPKRGPPSVAGCTMSETLGGEYVPQRRKR